MEKERYGDECKCETCGYEPLKHFEKCPNCNSESYHITTKESEINRKEEVRETWRLG